MPELPEVETVRRDLEKKILGRKIRRVEVRAQKIVQSPLAEFEELISGNAFTKIERRGKLMAFGLQESKKWMLAHLKMTGQLIYREGEQVIAGGHSWPEVDELPNKHTHLIFEFEDGSTLFFNDLRKFGYVKIVDEKGKKEAWERFGMEPLTPDFDLRELEKLFKTRKKSIKAVLLDQSLISGLGNIYTDEVCFASGVHPERGADSLKSAEVKKIYEEIEKILRRAIELRGTTFSDFRNADGQKGNFEMELQVYGREGESCPCCQGEIKKKKVAGRGTHFCEKCQK